MALKVSMVVQMRDPSSGDVITCTVTDVNPAVFSGGDITTQAAYQAADTVGRRICALTNNTYIDSVITTSESATEKLIG